MAMAVDQPPLLLHFAWVNAKEFDTIDVLPVCIKARLVIVGHAHTQS